MTGLVWQVELGPLGGLSDVGRIHLALAASETYSRAGHCK